LAADVGSAFDERLQKGGVVARVVLEVRVLDDRERHADLGDRPAQRGTLALIRLHPEWAHPRVAFGAATQDGPGAVGRPIVDGDHLADLRPLQDVLQDDLEGSFLVEGRNHDRENPVQGRCCRHRVHNFNRGVQFPYTA